MSDLDRILADLDRHEHIFDLGDDHDLGDRLLDIAVGRNRANFDAELDPDGGRLPALSEDYEKAKLRKYPGKTILRRTDTMRDGFEGERAITESEASWTFGQTPEQRDEAQWATEGDPARNRPPRPFVGLTDEARRLSAELLDQHFKDQL